jgi:WS/DGAT/MGAT family acyltransferase
MTYSHHERLSALDESFLALEGTNAHMHIGGVALFDAGPLSRPEGGVDIDRIRTLMSNGMYLVPRYRQKIVYTPVYHHPVWVDDDRFNLHYHLRHTQLPPPGDARMLKRLAGRIMSQQLDRGKPLWELWIVEGVEGGKVAVITKVHHCMIDGVGSVALTGSLMRPDAEPDPRLTRPAPQWLPRPAPTPARLLLDEVVHRAGVPFAALGGAARALAAPTAALRGAIDAVAGLGEAIGAGLHPASPTPLNVDIGPHRRFDWTVMDFEAIRDVKARLGGTVNDVALTVVAGAMRRFLHRRGLSVDTLDFRAMLPVNARAAADGGLGNKVTMLLARLPLDEPDPRRRLERVVAETRERKGSRQAIGVRTIEELSDRIDNGLFIEFARLTARSRPFNLVVTNVPGPQFPVYMLGAPMRACYPLVPLYQNQALGIALFSYDNRLFWGFNADWDALPDLHDLVEAVDHEFETLRSIATTTPEPMRAATG